MYQMLARESQDDPILLNVFRKGQNELLRLSTPATPNKILQSFAISKDSALFDFDEEGGQ